MSRILKGEFMKFKPLHDRVLIEVLDGSEKTAGGIIIPDSAQEKPQEGKVIAIGGGSKTEDGKIILSMVTQIIQFPQKKVLRTIALAGERFKEVHSQFSDMLASYALKNECSSLELWGRKGWKKMLPDWKDSYIVFTKDLKERMH